MKLKTSVRVIVVGLVFLSLSLSMIFAVSAVDATVVKVDPASQTVVNPGDSFSVNVRVEDVTYMGADGATLNFDPGAMSVSSVTAGDFLKSAGATMPIELIDNTVGTVAFAYSLITPGVGVTGSDVLATINFDTNPAAAAGEYNLDFTNVELLNGDGNEITVDEISNGTVTIGPEPTATPTPTPTKPSNGDGGDRNDVPGTTPTPTLTLTPTPTPTPTTTSALVPTTTASTSTPAVTSIPVGAVVFKVCPATQQVVTAGQSFSVDVRVEGVANMGADQACLNFEPGAMQATGIVEGDWLKDCPGGGGTIPIEEIDNTTGTATFMYSLLEQGVGVNGTGILATINFDTEPVAEGVYNLNLTNVLLLDGDGHEITVDAVIDGEVTIQPVPSPMSGTGMIAIASISIILAIVIALAITISAQRMRKRKA